MKKSLQSFLAFVLTSTLAFSQNTYTVLDKVVFYDGYASTVDEPVPAGVTRINNATYTTKLSTEMLSNLSLGQLDMKVTVGALCDNYDRLGHVYLAFVPKGATSYNQNEVDRIEIGRIITPFMNKNNNPKEVSYDFKVDNVAELFKDSNLLSQYDIWAELEIFGVPYAANTQVAGCAGRNDVFEGTLAFTTSNATETYTHPHFILPLSVRQDLNNYNATDVPGQTTRIINFTLNQPIENAVLYLITSNHGANAGGEEYERREHFVYLNDQLIYNYIPGGKSCEPWRQFNTQGNGIYGSTPKTTRQWLDFNNWCPGDKIPNREVVLGNLPVGNHTIKLDVPSAVFVNQEGYFPISMYIQNRKSGQVFCVDPSNLEVTDFVHTGVKLNWQENGDATKWELLYGRRNLLSQENFVEDLDGETGMTIDGLTVGWFYQFYVRSKCDNDLNSSWIGPISPSAILKVDDVNQKEFKISPNPTKSFVEIQAQKQIQNIQITNLKGILIQETKNLKVDLSHYPKGVYLMTAKFSDGSMTTKKLIKE